MNIGIDAKHTKPIGFEPKQYEFDCPCGYVWIDCENTGCHMCSERDGITVKPYDIKQPKEFPRK